MSKDLHKGRERNYEPSGPALLARVVFLAGKLHAAQEALQSLLMSGGPLARRALRLRRHTQGGDATGIAQGPLVITPARGVEAEVVHATQVGDAKVQLEFGAAIGIQHEGRDVFGHLREAVQALDYLLGESQILDQPLRK